MNSKIRYLFLALGLLFGCQQNKSADSSQVAAVKPDKADAEQALI